MSGMQFYKCKKENNCQIKNDLRNTCRACRLQRCFDVGLVCPKSEEYKRQLAATTKKQGSNFYDQDLTISTTTTPSSLMSELSETSSPYPTLDHLLKGIRTFLDSQKSLVLIEKQFQQGPMDDEFILIKKPKYDLLEKGCISLVYSMLNEYFEPFCLLQHEQKIELMKSLLLKFSILTKSYLSAKNFPDSADHRLMTHPGYIIDLNYTEYFFLDKSNPKGIWPCMLEGIKLLYCLKKKFVKQGISEMDISALAYVIYSIESEKLAIHIETVEQVKNSVFKELLTYYVSNFGFDQGAIKYSNLLNLVHNINEVKNWFHECYTAAKIFDPTLLYVWEDCC
uniref:Nuclear receptor domain-containing protein n=1 Tax=Acrobeloides nanus TaxID=290746 RepID=A0A914DJ92_9BILA